MVWRELVRQTVDILQFERLLESQHHHDDGIAVVGLTDIEDSGDTTDVAEIQPVETPASG